MKLFVVVGFYFADVTPCLLQLFWFYLWNAFFVSTEILYRYMVSVHIELFLLSPKNHHHNLSATKSCFVIINCGAIKLSTFFQMLFQLFSFPHHLISKMKLVTIVMSMMLNEHGMNINNEWRKLNAGKFDCAPKTSSKDLALILHPSEFPPQFSFHRFSSILLVLHV